jgi:hypothetical protein
LQGGADGDSSNSPTYDHLIENFFASPGLTAHQVAMDLLFLAA